MSQVEVFMIEDACDIQDTVNSFCSVYNRKPISASTYYSEKDKCYVVTVVVSI